MEIVPIFADQLFSFHYEDEKYNEYDRLMALWSNVKYLKKYAEKNGETDVKGFVKKHLMDIEAIQDLLAEIEDGNEPLEHFFRPLFDSELGIKILSLQKGKIEEYKNTLRIYAIKIDENCFLITGGAIKMSQKMQDHPDSNNELSKINKAKEYLKDNDVVDEDSFYEFIKEV